MKKKHIKQNDERLNERIQKIGCFFRSCGIIAENQTGETLSAEQLNRVWKWARDTKRIDDEENVRDSASIATRFLRELGNGRGRFFEIGTFKDGKLTYYPSIPLEFRRPDALIQKIRQGGPSKYHFRVVDKYGELVEDPHEPEIKVLGIEYSIIYVYAE